MSTIVTGKKIIHISNKKPDLDKKHTLTIKTKPLVIKKKKKSLVIKKKPKSGKINCKGCYKKFKSSNTKKIKYCTSCQQKNVYNNTSELTFDIDSKDLEAAEQYDFEIITKILKRTRSLDIPEEEIAISLELEVEEEPVKKAKIKTFGENDVDVDSLVKDIISGKTIYYDYNKNIIYNRKFTIIGSINEDGEIYLDDAFRKDYKELLED